MADETRDNTPPTEEKKPSALPTEARYPVAYWRERARLTFGVSPHAIAGALSADTTAELSEDEVRERLAAFDEIGG